ncbi:chorismate mutase [Candidatus Woesearchaeota archaeon]|nr:chorismate mutase [Candidatus Woesearchaeota archaeon]
MNQKLKLDDDVRPILVRMEDSIILDLFERAQFKTNDIAYTIGGLEIPEFKVSFFEYLFRGIEEVHAKAGRYEHPEEHSFFDKMPKPIVKRKKVVSPIKIFDINVNEKIKEIYLEALKSICIPGDDDHYGSSIVLDIKTLQDLSRRVHYGNYVAEAKFQEDPEGYSELIKARNTEGIMERLTNLNVERDLLERVRTKGKRYNVNPVLIESFFKDKIIPLTKEVEIEYFYKLE